MQVGAWIRSYGLPALPAVGGAGALLASGALYGLVFPVSDPSFAKDCTAVLSALTSKGPVSEPTFVAAGYMWLAAAVFVVVVGTAAMCAAVYLIHASLGAAAVQVHRLVIGLAMLVGAIVGWYMYLQGHRLFLHQCLVAPTVGTRIDNLLVTARILRAFSFAAGTSVIAAACAASFTSGTQLSTSRRIEHLGGQMRRLQAALYLSATILVAEVLQENALFNWTAAYAGTESQVRAVRALATAAATFSGTAFSLLLAAVYVPAGLLLTNEVHRMVASVGQDQTQTERNKWLEERGLAFPFRQHVGTVVAILGPGSDGWSCLWAVSAIEQMTARARSKKTAQLSDNL